MSGESYNSSALGLITIPLVDPLTSLNDILPPTPGIEFKARDVYDVCIALALPVIFFVRSLA